MRKAHCTAPRWKRYLNAIARLLANPAGQCKPDTACEEGCSSTLGRKSLTHILTGDARQ